MVVVVIYLLTEQEIYKFKVNNETVDVPIQFLLNFLINVEHEEVSIKRNVYDVLVEYDAFDKSKILNICKYLMIKDNIKNVWTC